MIIISSYATVIVMLTVLTNQAENDITVLVGMCVVPVLKSSECQ
jgi:hypothetical protein